MTSETIQYQRDDKEFLKLYKLIFSSLFARKQPHLYFSRKKDKVGYFTSIYPDRLVVSRPNIDQTIHRAILTSHSFIDLIGTYLPLRDFDSEAYCVNISELANLIRETETNEQLHALLHKSDEGYVYVTRIRKIDKVPTEIKIPVFYHITEGEIHQSDDYLQTVCLWVDTSANKTTMTLDTDTVQKTGVTLTEVVGPLYDKVADRMELVHIPYVDGFSTVSISEFIKKQKDDSKLKLYVGQTGKVIRTYYHFKNDEYDILSACPAAFYYHRSNNRLESKEIKL